jgi:hypothetical protein
MNSKVLLIRNSSEFSSEVENYFIKQGIPYDVLYSDEKQNMPIIYAPLSRVPFFGRTGFNLFKGSYLVQAVGNKVAC